MADGYLAPPRITVGQARQVERASYHHSLLPPLQGGPPISVNTPVRTFYAYISSFSSYLGKAVQQRTAPSVLERYTNSFSIFLLLSRPPPLRIPCVCPVKCRQTASGKLSRGDRRHISADSRRPSLFMRYLFLLGRLQVEFTFRKPKN